MTVDALEISELCQSGRMGPCRMLSAPLWGVGRCWGTGQDLTGVPAQPAVMPARPSCCRYGQSAQLMEVELAVDWHRGPICGWAGAENPGPGEGLEACWWTGGVPHHLSLATKVGGSSWLYPHMMPSSNILLAYCRMIGKAILLLGH